MLTFPTMAVQITAARDDRLRVLIVGAGVAGLTLARLLRGQGLHPVLVERAGPDIDSGYMLALMPLVDPVISKLGVGEEYCDRSVGVHRYRVHDRSGAPLREYSLDDLLARFGDYRGIERGQLLSVLASGGAPVSFRTTVTALKQTRNSVRAHLVDATGELEAEFDVVVAADGLHSTTRELALGTDQVDTYDTGWGGWVAWADSDSESDLIEETWGAGFFLGIYPVRGRVGVFVGGNRHDTTRGPAQFVAQVREELRIVDERAERALAAVAADAGTYYWSLTDARSMTWSVGRVALLGDAAAGFLPTAGIGAAMAMESAGTLAARLGETTKASVPEALRGYERVQRPRVESAQDNSRQLARLMLHRSRTLAAVRDLVTRFVPLKLALGPIRKLLANATVKAPVGG